MTIRSAIFFVLIAAIALAAQQPVTSDVNTMLREARKEIGSFEKAGGRKDDPNHPVQKWVEALWALREKSPRTPEAAKATSEAVRLLIYAGRFEQAYTRADHVAADDPAWDGLAHILFDGASAQKNFTYFFQKLQAVLPKATDSNVRASIRLSLGRGWHAERDDEKAKAAFEAAIESARDSFSGIQAERELYDLLHLSPGQPAPQFSAAAINGARISLADHRSRPVLLVFWGTH